MRLVFSTVSYHLAFTNIYLCKEEKVGFVDLWDCFVGKDARDRRYLSAKRSRCFCIWIEAGRWKWIEQRTETKLDKQGIIKRGSTWTTIHISSKGERVNIKSGFKYVCLNARGIINKKSELNLMVDDINPHIIGVTESWANKDVWDAESDACGDYERRLIKHIVVHCTIRTLRISILV